MTANDARVASHARPDFFVISVAYAIPIIRRLTHHHAHRRLGHAMKRSNPLSHTSSVARVRPFLLAGAIVLLLPLIAPKTAQAQEPVACEDAVTTANNHFLIGRFDEAIELLEDCLRQDAFSDEEKPAVYKLLVQVFDANGLEEKVKEMLADLLELVPNYEPDPDDAEAFKGMVEAYKQDMAQAAAQEETPVEEEEEAPPVEEPEPEPVVAVTLAAAQGVVVRNVRLSQEDGRVVVAYDLVGTAKKYEVGLLLSTDGGRNFLPLPQRVAGDVGKDIQPGAGKEMTWAALEDFPQGLAGDQYRVQVTAQKQGGGALLYILGAVVAGGGATAALLLGGGGGGDEGGGNGGNDPPPPPPAGIPAPPGRPGGN